MSTKQEQTKSNKDLTEEEKKQIKEQKKKEKEEKKKQREKERQEKLRAQQQQQNIVKISNDAFVSGEAKFGHLPPLQSTFKTGVTLEKIGNITANTHNEQTVTVRARIHTVRGKGKSCFILLREGCFSIQVTLFATDEQTKSMAKYAQKLTKESIVQISGKVVKVDEEIASATQKDVEIQMHTVYCISSAEHLPIQVEDCMRVETKEEQMKATDNSGASGSGSGADGNNDDKDSSKLKGVGQYHRLNHRVIDMRAPAQSAIFKIQSALGRFFREYLYKLDFTEIHTPKMIGAASEGGAEVFKVHYFDRYAYLAQSPQLYKQMAVEGDLMRVFEVAPMFRAENSFTHRHMTEFVGVDMEMAFQDHYHEVLDVIDSMFVHIFNRIEEVYAKELEVIKTQFPFEPIVYKQKNNLRITYSEGIRLLNEKHNLNLSYTEDIDSENERKLGAIIKEKYNTDFFILDKFPMSVRPFYTMPDPEDPNLSNSYDVFLRGEEISSGAQRIHEAELLEKLAKEKNVDIEPLQSYVDAFRYGAWPHAGCGIGLERVVMLYLDLGNVRKTSMFPRDPKRIYP